MWSASSGGFRRGWLRDGYRAELLPAAPLHRHACSLAAAAAPQTRPATCPRRAPLRRRRHVSRLCEPPGDTARLQVLFQRFLQLRDVFSLDDFLSGWQACCLPLAGPSVVGWAGVGIHRGVGWACWRGAAEARPAHPPADPAACRRFLGAPPSAILRGNLEDFVSYGFYCKVRPKRRRARSLVRPFMDARARPHALHVPLPLPAGPWSLPLTAAVGATCPSAIRPRSCCVSWLSRSRTRFGGL